MVMCFLFPFLMKSEAALMDWVSSPTGFADQILSLNKYCVCRHSPQLTEIEINH